jgi:hypothetical protein
MNALDWTTATRVAPFRELPEKSAFSRYFISLFLSAIISCFLPISRASPMIDVFARSSKVFHRLPG